MEQEKNKGRMRKAPYTAKQMADLIVRNCDFADEGRDEKMETEEQGSAEDYEIKDGDLLIYITYRFWQTWEKKSDIRWKTLVVTVRLVKFLFECDRIVIMDKEGNDYGITFSLHEMENAVEDARMKERTGFAEKFFKLYKGNGQ